MFLGKYTINFRSVLAVFAVAITVFSAGASITNAQQVRNTLHDFVGTRATDWTTLSFTEAGPIRWRITGNPANPAPNQAFKREFDYGLTDSDSLVVGDYVGDNKSDLAIWRDTNAVFYISDFPVGTGGITLNRAVPFGNTTDVPGIQGDYDGDGKDDYALARGVLTSPGVTDLAWYILSSSTNTFRTVIFGRITGQTGPAVFPGADFNADGRDELVFVVRTGAGAPVTYYIGDSITGAGVLTRRFGDYDTDYSFAPDDYTGDGRADFIASRQTQGDTQIWYIQDSATAAVTATSFGISDPAFIGEGDSPVRGDFDGDGKHDICVWRASDQTFYYISSQFNNIQSQKAGDATDTPLGTFGLY